MRKKRCFIASAFGLDEVDSIYDQVIVPTLKELEILPFRVDRINHNKKIDAKIIQLMNECDFGIADLTFARPSVYFEAGFIEGLSKNVIYIVRQDHFKPRPDDIHGNNRVHFDLITQNIIGWSKPNADFKKRLKARLKHVLQDVNPKVKLSEQELQAREHFRTLALSEKIKDSKLLIKEYLLKKKFKPISMRFIENGYESKLLRICFEVKNSLTMLELRLFANHLSDFSSSYSRNAVKLTFVLQKVPRTRVERGLAYFRPTSDCTFEYRSTKIMIFDQIDSLEKIKSILTSLSIK